MQCPNCGKTGFVTISNKRYCSNCGAKVAGGPAPAVSDIRRSPGVSTVPQAALASAPVTTPKPATQLHGQQVGSKSSVLDLRKPAAKPEPAPEAQAPSAAIIPSPKPVMPPAPIVTEPTPPANPQALNADKTRARLEKASTIPKSELVQKFGSGPTLLPAAAPDPVELPNAVATQVDAMKQIASSAASPQAPQSEILKQVISGAKPNRFNPTSVAAALAAIVIMGGYIWTQNYPKMSFHVAASKAGLEATLPGYLPASYHQAGPVSYQPGEITLNFASAGASEPLKITQRKTDWDSNSLRENYVSKQTDNYLAVQGQGLTIYMYNSNQASWVNHGVWYQINGVSQLGREQVLKIAYSL